MLGLGMHRIPASWGLAPADLLAVALRSVMPHEQTTDGFEPLAHRPQLLQMYSC